MIDFITTVCTPFRLSIICVSLTFLLLGLFASSTPGQSAGHAVLEVKFFGVNASDDSTHRLLAIVVNKGSVAYRGGFEYKFSKNLGGRFVVQQSGSIPHLAPGKEFRLVLKHRPLQRGDQFNFGITGNSSPNRQNVLGTVN